ncbi:MAG: ABC transporter ATP-binding protein [Gammaproteobacteria bacterium TMED119]|nr:MAG: ABC transporter ATP-binding protein [Gammaproteobacteria bacterium TMED119]|tara:strand:+ start:385 stop:2034 length:1650 start_codon:yes stop_codon:yes gene_type:complete
MNTLLHIDNLSTDIQLSDRIIPAVKRVSLQVHQGETVALVGESGSGKSITALSIARLLPDAGRVTSGQVLLHNENLLAKSERAMRSIRGNRIAMIFQEPMTSLNPVIKIGQQIIESILLHERLSKTQAKQRCLSLLDAVGLPEPARNMAEYPHQLSGGMRQRVMIAIALATNPELLIADEPTTALDVTIQAQVLALLKSLQEQRNMGMIFITHDLGVVQQIADRVIVMRHGEIVENALSADFFKAPQHAYSQQLLNALPSMEKRGLKLSDHTHSVDQQNSADFSQQAILKVDHLVVHFPIKAGVLKTTVGHVKAVNGVSFELNPGRTLALVGESGCGKTTVGKSILQLLSVTAGAIEFSGDNLLALKGEQLLNKRRDLQIIFQDPYSSLNPRMLIGDIIEEGMIALGADSLASERSAEIDELLHQVGLPEDARNRYPHEFSGGQRQRICIARALAVKPKVIICDEPTSALDVSVQAQVLNLLKDLQNKLGMSYLFITHDMAVVSYLADDVAVMNEGVIVEQGSVQEVLTQPKHAYTKRLLSAVPHVSTG